MATRPIQVLLVDDSADDVALILRELRRAGYDPTAERVETAAGFLAALAGRVWDVILCDNSMPAFDAQGALGLLRESGLDVPLVVVSGGIGDEQAVVLMRAGAADFVMKDNLGRLAMVVEREARQAVERLERRRADERQAPDALLLANVRDAVIVTDPNGITTYWNDGATRLFGWTATEMVGRPLTDRVPEPHREQMAGATRAILAGVEHFGEWEDWRKDGTRVWIDARVSRITDYAGNVVGVLGLSHDITDRKGAEEALHASEERYRTVVADQTEVVCRVRADGTFLFVNDALCRLIGKPANELLGRPGPAFPHPEDASRVEDALATLSPDNPVVRVEHRVLDADGRTRWMEFVNRGFFGPRRGTEGVAGGRPGHHRAGGVAPARPGRVGAAGRRV